jgi:hypothetical protein
LEIKLIFYVCIELGTRTREKLKLMKLNVCCITNIRLFKHWTVTYGMAKYAEMCFFFLIMPSYLCIALAKSNFMDYVGIFKSMGCSSVGAHAHCTGKICRRGCMLNLYAACGAIAATRVALLPHAQALTISAEKTLLCGVTNYPCSSTRVILI